MLLLFAGLGQLLQFISGTGPIDPRVLFERFFPPHDIRPGMDPFSPITETLARLTEVGNSLSLVAIPAFVWFSTRLFAGIRTSLNSIYDAWVRPKRMHPVKRLLISKLRDLAMVFLVLILFLANVVLTTGYALLQAATQASGAGSVIQTLEGWLGQALGFLFLLALFFVMYRHASLRRVGWQAALVASAFASVAFEIAKRLFALYITKVGVFSAATTAGASIGAIILFVVWVYYSALVFLLGGVIAETWELRSLQRVQRGMAWLD